MSHHVQIQGVAAGVCPLIFVKYLKKSVAVDRERGEDNMNINYDVTGLLTAVSPQVTSQSCLMLIWLVREKGGRRCIVCMREL